MFSGRLKIAKDTRGNYFIDRDGELFRHVLNYMRTSQLCLPESFEEFDQLSIEADFYQITGLIDALEACKRKRRKNPKLPENQGVIILAEDKYRHQILLSGKADLVKAVFEEFINPSEFVLSMLPARGYARAYSVPWRPGGHEMTKAEAFDVLYANEFTLKASNGGGGDGDVGGTQFQEYVFVRDHTPVN